jgi:hypothetical protein
MRMGWNPIPALLLGSAVAVTGSFAQSSAS